MSQYPLWNQLNTLKEAQWVDLTHTFDPNIPRFSEFERYSMLKIMGFMYNVGVS